MAPTFMLSVYRSLSIDWQATTTVHGGLLVVCITLFLFRHRISQVVIASFICLTFLLIGIAGYATLGMMSGGLAFSITAVLCSTALIGRRVGVGDCVCSAIDDRLWLPAYERSHRSQSSICYV